MYSFPLRRRNKFLLTRPLRDVTYRPRRHMLHRYISTHTPLAGRDPSRNSSCFLCFPFLLTRPLRDVTNHATGKNFNNFISTHTPLAGRDVDGRIRFIAGI